MKPLIPALIAKGFTVKIERDGSLAVNGEQPLSEEQAQWILRHRDQLIAECAAGGFYEKGGLDAAYGITSPPACPAHVAAP